MKIIWGQERVGADTDQAFLIGEQYCFKKMLMETLALLYSSTSVNGLNVL